MRMNSFKHSVKQKVEEYEAVLFTITFISSPRENQGRNVSTH